MSSMLKTAAVETCLYARGVFAMLIAHTTQEHPTLRVAGKHGTLLTSIVEDFSRFLFFLAWYL